jgi:hypothetical protein
VTRSSAKHQTGLSTEAEHGSRRIESGNDLLDNNAVNLLMAAIMSLGGILAASYFWEVPLDLKHVI